MTPIWHLYVLQCADGTLYAGVTTDLQRRVEEHNSGTRAARYTRARRPVSLLRSWALPDRSAATKAEAAFKRLSRSHKLDIIAGHRPLPCGAPL